MGRRSKSNPLNLFFALFLSVTLWAAPSNLDVKTFWEGKSKRAVSKMRDAILDAQSGQTDSRNSECQNTYRRLYKDGERYSEGWGAATVNMHLAFGYANYNNDERDGVVTHAHDYIDRKALEEYLRKDCPKSIDSPLKACGFKPDGPDLLFKMITGPDGNRKRFNLHLSHSAVSIDDSENRKNPKQATQSQKSKDNFLSGIKTGDIVIYQGHSRSGGGPGFSPPKLNARGQVDAGWYRSANVGESEMLKALKERQSTSPLLLGVLGCESSRYFKDPVLKRAPQMSWVGTTREPTFDETLSASFGIINSLLRFDCQDHFQETLNLSSKINDVKSGGIKIENFQENKPTRQTMPGKNRRTQKSKLSTQLGR